MFRFFIVEVRLLDGEKLWLQSPHAYTRRKRNAMRVTLREARWLATCAGEDHRVVFRLL